MTQEEIKNKIADYESRLKNPSVASVPSAVSKLNSLISDLKSQLKEDKPIKVYDRKLSKGKVWTAEQKEKVADLDVDFENLVAEKGIDRNSKEAADLWRSAGFQSKMMAIFNKDKELKTEGQKAKERGLKEADVAEKLMSISAEVEDTLKVPSGGELREDLALQKKWIKALDKKIKKSIFKGVKPRLVYDILEDENYHNLNNYLVLKGYLEEVDKKDYIEATIKSPKSYLSLSLFGIDDDKSKSKKSITEYEDDVYEAIVSIGEMSRSDAQGIGEANDSIIKEYYKKGNSAESAAKKILNVSDKDDAKSEKNTAKYNCDDLIAKEKERVKKAKEAAKKRAAEPEKTEVTKAKEKIERTHETIEKKIEKGEFTKAQISKLIGETKDLLKMLEKALKSL